MIVYRKQRTLRVRTHRAPEPPFYCATTLAPYTFPRSTELAIDYIDSAATSSSRLDVSICDAPRDQVERERSLRGPVLIEATGVVEGVFEAGAVLADSMSSAGISPLLLTSIDGKVPAPGVKCIIAIATWPHEPDHLAELARFVGPRSWGIVIPIVPILTAAIERVEQMITIAKTNGAQFAIAQPLDLDASARNAVASLAEADEETFAALFDERDFESVSAERHIAAVATENGLSDALPASLFEADTNWGAAVVLARTSNRMFRMEHEVELAWTLQKSSRLIASLNKQIDRVAEAASLSIIEGLDEISVEILESWLSEGRSQFVDAVDERWRLRRDLYR